MGGLIYTSRNLLKYEVGLPARVNTWDPAHTTDAFTYAGGGPADRLAHALPAAAPAAAASAAGTSAGAAVLPSPSPTPSPPPLATCASAMMTGPLPVVIAESSVGSAHAASDAAAALTKAPTWAEVSP